MKIGFIGMGNMAKAMIGGMLAKKVASADEITGSAKTEKTRKLMRETYGIHVAEDNRTVAQEAEYLFLVVKPQFYEEVLKELEGTDLSGKTVISIAPGKTIAWLSEKLRQQPGVVRCIPNTPALVGEGCTGVCFGETVSEKAKKDVLAVLNSFGKAVELEERLMDAAGSVSGCSPAFVFQFLEAMADAGVAEGLPRALAYELSAQALLGSAKMVLETGKHPGELKDMVCSPAGSTIRGVKVLEERGFRGAVMDAVCASIEASRKL